MQALNASKMNQSLLMADQCSESIIPFSANLILPSSIGWMHYGPWYVCPGKAEVGFFLEVIRLNGQIMFSPVPTLVKFSQKAKVMYIKDLL